MRDALIALAVSIIVLIIVDAGVSRWFPMTDRLSTNFSARYLDREIQAEREGAPIVVVGDSALWGYGIPSQSAAFSRLRARGFPIVNLSYEGGSLPNSYALLRLLLDRGMHPRLVVFNVNQKEFNALDSAYRTLHPSVERLAWSLLPRSFQDLLARTQKDSPELRLERWLEFTWYLYGMRSDERALAFGADDFAHAFQARVEDFSGAATRRAEAHRPTPERFEGTYDLTPLDPSNVGVAFLDGLGELLRRKHIPALAILTPTNHGLLHEYIDVPEYRANLDWTNRRLKSFGVRVLDLDRAFPASSFLDNDHLTVEGNATFARILEPYL